MVGRSYLERGEPVLVVARWGGEGPRNVLVRRANGALVVRPFRGLRRADRPGQRVQGEPGSRTAEGVSSVTEPVVAGRDVAAESNNAAGRLDPTIGAMAPDAQLERASSSISAE